MTRTKNSVVEPRRSPLQTRAGALLTHIFSPDSRQAAARRAAARSSALETTRPNESVSSGAAGSSSSQQQQPYGSCGSPTLGGGSSAHTRDTAVGLQQAQRQLSGSIYDIGSVDDEDYSGLSDLLIDDDEHLAPAGTAVAAVPTAAAAAAAVAGMHGVAASTTQATPEQAQEQPKLQHQQCSPAPAAVAPTAGHDTGHHDAVDAHAYILDTTDCTAAATAEAQITVGQHTADDPDGFNAVDKMLEQMSVDVLLDQQYLLEQQQQRGALKQTIGSAAVCNSNEHQHPAMHRHSSAPLPLPTGPPAAAVVLQAAGTAATHDTVPGAQQGTAATIGGLEQRQQQHQSALVHANSTSKIPQVWQQQHLHQVYSAPLIGEQFVQSGVTNTEAEAVTKPFSFQDLLMSDEPMTNMQLSASFDVQQQQQQGSAFQPLSQQQPLQSPGPRAASWEHQHVTWEPQRHAYQQQQLHSAHSAPLPVGTAAAPHQHAMTPQYSHTASNLQTVQQPWPPAGQTSSVSFYHQSQQVLAGQHGYFNPHQAQLEALKAQLAEEKRRRKEKKRMKKLHKIMQQQQQQQQGLARQVLHAAGPTNHAVVAAAFGRHGAPPYPVHLAPAHSGLRHQPGLPHPPWYGQNPRRSSRDSGIQLGNSKGASIWGHGSGSRGSREPPEDPAAVAARQHAVAHNLRQLAFKTEQMRRAGSAGPAPLAPAPAGGQHAALHAAAAPTRSSSLMALTSHVTPGPGPQGGRPPVTTPEHGSSYASHHSTAAGQLPAPHSGGCRRSTAQAVLNLQQHSPAVTPPAQHTDGMRSANDNSSNFMPGSNSMDRDYHEVHPVQDGEYATRATDRANTTAKTGPASWREHQADAVPTTSGARALDLRSADSAPPLNPPSHCEVDAIQGHGGDFHTANIETMRRAASADAAAAIKLHGTPSDSATTRMVCQTSPHAAAGNTAAAVPCDGTVASPVVSTTSSSGRKRNWHLAAEGCSLQLAPERKLTAISSTGDLHSMLLSQRPGEHNAHGVGHLVQYQQQHSSSQKQQQQQQHSALGSQGLITSIPQAVAPFTGPSKPMTQEFTMHRGSSAAGGWLRGAQQGQYGLHNVSQLQQQLATEQRQQRLLQLPFNRADVAEQRRQTITTELPAVLNSPPARTAAQQQQQQAAPPRSLSAAASPSAGDTRGTSSLALDAHNTPAGSPMPTISAAAAAAAARTAVPSSSAPAAAEVMSSSPAVGNTGTSSTNGALREPHLQSDTVSHGAPGTAAKGSTSRLASTSAHPTGGVGLSSHGLGSPGLRGTMRQQSLSDAAAAAATVAAGSGGSGDLSSYLGGFGSPGVYRTSSGKVLRMLTHPVTGKPLLLGPAVDAKLSRLGNTSLGAPSPQLFGRDIQHTPLSGKHLPAPSAVQAVLAGAAGAGAAGPHGGPGTLSSNSSGHGAWMQGSTGRKRHRSGSTDAAAAYASGDVALVSAGMHVYDGNAHVLASDMYSQQLETSSLQLQMPVLTGPGDGTVGAAGAWGPDGGMPSSVIWDQQVQVAAADPYADDGLLYLETQQQPAEQQQVNPVHQAGAATFDVFAAAAAAVAEPSNYVVANTSSALSTRPDK